MRIKRFWVTAITLTLSLIGLGTGVAYAANANEIVQGTTNASVYRAGGTITVDGTINGDVFCLGQTVTISATVNGDVLCAAQDVTVLGRVNGNVRVSGQTVNLDATVTGSAAVLGQSVVIGGDTTIARDLSIAAQTATINGKVSRDVTGTVQSITLAGPVGRSVSLHTNKLVLASGTDISGDLTYTSPARLEQRTGSHLLGSVVYYKAQEHHWSMNGFVWAKIYWMLAIAAMAMVLVALCPQKFRRLNPTRAGDFWQALLIGFVAMIAVPVVVVILMLTLIGIPLGIILLLSWIVAAFVSMAFAAYYIGNLIAPKMHPVLIVLIGAVVLGMIELIPILGWIVGLVAYWVGVGILLRGIKRYYKRPVYDK